MNSLLDFGKKALVVLAIGCVFAGTFQHIPAEAKKKAAAAVDPVAQAEAEMKKTLDPVSGQLLKLTQKIEGRGLLSSEEAGQLVDIKYKLLDLLNQFPTNAVLTKPVYQAAYLFMQREEYNDAFELFNYLSQGFPANPYGAKAKGQMQSLQKRFGADYFSAEALVTLPTAPAAGTEGTAAGASGTPTAADGAAPATKK